MPKSPPDAFRSGGPASRASETLADVPTILAAEWAGGEWNGWIRWMATYTTPETGDRLPFDSQGEHP